MAKENEPEENKEPSTLQNLIFSSDFRLEGLLQLLEDKGIVTKEEILNHLENEARRKREEEQKRDLGKKEGADPNADRQAEEWQDLMDKMDSQMPRTLEDIYDGLISFGIPLESFAPYVQEAYKSKKEARSRRPF